MDRPAVSPYAPTPRRSVGSGAVAECRPRPNRLLLVATRVLLVEPYVVDKDLRCCRVLAV